MDLSIIILTYKDIELAKQCLASIFKADLKLDYEIIVVDNGSSDSGIDEVEKIEHVKLIKSEKNLGFSGGNNLGLKKAQGDYILILNPDVIIESGGIEKMIEFLKNNPQVGLAGPKLVNDDGSLQYSCRRFYKFLTPLYRRTFLGKFSFGKKELRKIMMKDFDHEENGPVDWLLGACFLTTNKHLDKVGLLDERFFLYFEDMDLCRRFWQAGFQVYYFANTKFVHLYKRDSARKIFSLACVYHLQSWLKYSLKWFGKKLPR